MKTSMLLAALPAVLGAAAAAPPTTVFPPPPGYKVSWQSLELTDPHRVDPFNASHPRRIMISKFTPVPGHLCKKTCRVPYMSTEIATFEDDILTAYLGDVGWPQGLLSTLQLELCCQTRADASSSNNAHRFPTILFGTGLNTTRLMYSAIGQQLASLGYETIVMDHPYETDVVQFPNGDIIFGGRIGRDPNNTAVLEFGLDVRTADVSLVLDKLKVRKTVYMGHSFGGASAAAALMKESRIAAGANVDGALWGPVRQQGVSRPFFTVGAEGHSADEPSWDEFKKAMREKHPRVWLKEIAVGNASHGSFWDTAIMGDFTGLRGKNEILDEFFGKMPGKRAAEVLRGYLGDLVKFALLGKGEGLLKGPSDRFPEVTFVGQ